jgi:DNA-binding beta-propeller fold protein YncE
MCPIELGWRPPWFPGYRRQKVGAVEKRSRAGYGRHKFRAHALLATGVVVSAPLTMMVVVQGSAAAAPAGLVPSSIPAIPVGIQTTGIAVDPSTNTAYVVGSQGATTDQVSVVNATTGVIAGTVDLDAAPIVGAAPTAVAVDPTTGSVYVAEGASGTLATFPEANCDAAESSGCATPPTTIAVPDSIAGDTADPTAIAVDATTDTVFVANGDDGTISQITGGVATAIPGISFTPGGALTLAVDPARHAFYVGDVAAETVTAVDESTDAETTFALPAGASPSGLAVEQATGTLYVSDLTSGMVYDIDLANSAVGSITTPAPGDSLTAVTVDPSTDTVYATDQTTGQVVVIDGAIQSYVASVATGSTPAAIALDTAASPALVLIGDIGSNDVGVLSQQASSVTPPPVTPPVTPPPVVPPAAGATYDVAAANGAVASFTGSGSNLSPAIPGLRQPIVGIAETPDGGGYWLVASDGGVFAQGDASFYGSEGGTILNKPIVGIAPTPDGHGYWLVASDGGIFAFGDASFYGSTGGMALNQPIVGMAATTDGHGYWLAASDGGVFSFGDAGFYGSEGSTVLNQPVVGMTTTPTGHGYRLEAADGGTFVFGDATWEGSLGNLRLNQPIVGAATTPDGQGYWLFASDGGVFSFNAPFLGSSVGANLGAPVVGGASPSSGRTTS